MVAITYLWPGCNGVEDGMRVYGNGKVSLALRSDFVCDDEKAYIALCNDAGEDNVCLCGAGKISVPRWWP